MQNRYNEIKNKISEVNNKYYLNEKNSITLAENIASLNIDDVIEILVTLENDENLREMSRQRSVKNNVLDKLVIMTSGAQNPWVLRLHTYPVMNEDSGDSIQDDEEHVHYHRWDLTSKFLAGGFVNRQYEVSDNKDKGFHVYEYEIPSTEKSAGNWRVTKSLGEKYLHEYDTALYKKGDHVHYPIEVPHSVDSSSTAAYTGITITLAHTGESRKNTSTFFERKPVEMAPNARYTQDEHLSIIRNTITRLQLIKLCEELASNGIERFGHLNSLETELLPTIAMIKFEGDSFKEKNDDAIYIKTTIENRIKEMNGDSLQSLIISSQKILFKKGFARSIDELKRCDTKEAIKKRENVVSENVINNSGLRKSF